MTPTTTNACPRCNKPLASGTKFCAACGLDISGVWGVDAALGGTVAVEMDPNVDLLGQMLSEATLGDYDIYGELGRGGMAAVYLGLDLALNRKVAIKTMLPELVSKEGMVARFKREAQTAAALSHPHVIQIFTVKETPKLVYFVMKFIEGRSLESVINDKGGVPLDMAQVLLSQVGGALAYAHRKNVIHRDIKPANIMIDEDGWAIVTDFGIAKVTVESNLTATGTAIGTPHYMSPEQFHNKAVTGASDQYALGIVAYEMLTGKKPFDGGTYAEIITQHLFEGAPDPRTIKPDIPEGAVNVVKKMLAKDPADRFADCEEAVKAFAAVHVEAKKSGDVVRTQMISLAKSGPQKKVRMSVPMSPIPVQKKPSAPAATAIEPAAGKVKKGPKPVAAAAAAAPAEKSGGAGKWIFLTLLLLAVGGGGGYYYMNFMRPQAQTQTVAANSAAGGDAAAPVTQTPAADSAALAAAAEQRRQDSIATVIAERAQLKQDSARRADSIRTARLAANAAKAANTRAKAAPPPTTQVATKQPEPAPVQAPVQQQAAPPPAPVVPQTGQVRLGTNTPEAFLYINEKVVGSISTATLWTVPAGEPVRISIKSVKCTTPWDTTLTIAPNEQKTIGRRFPSGCQ
jgi:serine/threonine protein kinase